MEGIIFYCFNEYNYDIVVIVMEVVEDIGVSVLQVVLVWISVQGYILIIGVRILE